MTDKQKEGLRVYNEYYKTNYKPETDHDFERMYGELATRSHILGSGYKHKTIEEMKNHILECLEGWSENEYMRSKI